MKIGRNEPCSCGSGKKYKVCCGAGPDTESPQLLAWRRLNRAVQNHAPGLLSFIAESHGQAAIYEAWEEFTLWSGERFDPQSPQVTLFFPWLFHIWRPLTGETEVKARCLHSIPPSQAYLIAKGKSIDPLLYSYLSACLDAPFGFFEVISADPGHGMQMREILTETTYAVLERSASASLQAGHILYGTVVECDGIVMLEACAPVVIPVGMKPMIVEQRELLLEEEALEREQILAAMEEEDEEHEGAAALEPRLQNLALLENDFSNRELYWKLIQPLLNPEPPELHNTDGDSLSMQRLIFAIDSPAEAFEALKGLAVGHSEEELLRDAEYSADGALKRVEFSWLKRGNSQHKGCESTVLGRIEIDEKQLAAEVNSAERAAEFKRLVSKRLGKKARYRVTKIQSMERLMAEARANPRKSTTQADEDQAALMARPEVQAKLRDILTQHYDAWIDEKLPILRGKTPREAVRTAAGREKVDALIKDIERMGPGLGGYDRSITDNLRKRLGI
jgi:SEC-C motif